MAFARNDVVQISNKQSSNYGAKAVVTRLPLPKWTNDNPLPPTIEEVDVNVLDNNGNVIEERAFSTKSLSLVSRDTSNYHKFTKDTIVIDEGYENAFNVSKNDELGKQARKYGKIVDVNWDDDDGYRYVQILDCFGANKTIYRHLVLHVNELRVANNDEIKKYEYYVAALNNRNTQYIVMYDKIVRKDPRQRFDPRTFYFRYEQSDSDYDIEKDYFKIHGSRLEDSIKDLFSNEEVVSNSIEVYELGEKKKVQFSVEV